MHIQPHLLQERERRRLLQQMGLDVHLGALPGFGSLYYASEHRVYMIRKWNQMFECRYLHGGYVGAADCCLCCMVYFIALGFRILFLGNNYNDVL